MTPVCIVLGTLVKPLGLRGEVKLRQSADFWVEALQSAALVLRGDSLRRPVRIVRARPHSAGMQALQLEAVTERAQAESLIGAELVLEAEALDVPPPLAPRPFELLGVQVVLPDGSVLGVVQDVMQLPGQDVLVVHNGSREYLIPRVPAIVREQDSTARRLCIEPVPGLLEL